MGVCAHESVQVGTGPWLSECPWCGRSLLRPLALPADPHNLPSLGAKGLKTHANSEGVTQPLTLITLTHPRPLRGPEPLNPPTRARGSLPVGLGDWPPEKLGCPSAPARARRAEQVTAATASSALRAGGGQSGGGRRDGGGEAPPAGRPGRLGALAAAGGTRPGGCAAGRGPVGPGGPRPARRRVCKLKPSGARERGPARAGFPTDRLRTGGSEGGRELNENFRFLVQPLQWGGAGGVVVSGLK